MLVLEKTFLKFIKNFLLFNQFILIFFQIVGEKFGDPGMEDPHDWDSLSARVRRQRRQGHRTLMQRQKGQL